MAAGDGSAPPLRLLGIAGSLRSASYNRSLLEAARELAPEGVEIETFDLDDIPMFNQDVEAEGDPEPVAALKAAIREADALLVVTPEYNYGLPGVLKNALDWASRPPLGSPLSRKPVAVMGASPGVRGTARAQEQLEQTLSFPRATVVPDGQLRVGEAYEKFDEEGKLVDEATREQVRELLAGLSDAIERRPAPREAGSRASSVA